jgi:hypothetical protein
LGIYHEDEGEKDRIMISHEARTELVFY